jgi:hypothetical protein
MRKRFEAQLTLGSTSIDKIQIPLKCRDEFPSLMRALQHIYTDKDLSERVFSLLESVILPDNNTGRPGMDLWSIFVLASSRLCLNTDYDRLHYLSNSDSLLRQMLGVHDGIVRGREFERQTIIDNVHLLDDDALREINRVIVDAGHGIVKKKETEVLRVKIDSFVTEATVHFPTDYNLLWDSARKCLDVLGVLMDTDLLDSSGWRKRKYWRKELKNKMLKVSRSVADKTKNREKRLVETVTDYLDFANQLSEKIQNSVVSTPSKTLSVDLYYYHQMLEKHIDLVDRRLLKGEKIPHEEKIFSIFEPWVEWICKGKAHKPVELGKRTCIATDQWHFIVDWCVANNQQDNKLLLPMMDRIRQNDRLLSSCSADKGFFSKIDVQIMELFDIKVFIPKKGKRSISDLQKDSDPEFIKARRRHNAVESNINELEHRGLDRCPDKGIRGMQRYVGLAVIAYNLRRIGKILLERDRKAAGLPMAA